MGHFNCIWQGEANERILRSLNLCTSPPRVLNLTPPETIAVHSVSTRLGELMDCETQFTGNEADTAWLSDPAQSIDAFGPLTIELETMLQWTAYWTTHEGRSLGKPTHFEVRDGKY